MNNELGFILLLFFVLNDVFNKANYFIFKINSQLLAWSCSVGGITSVEARSLV